MQEATYLILTALTAGRPHGYGKGWEPDRER
jgi:hypothetical protein